MQYEVSSGQCAVCNVQCAVFSVQSVDLFLVLTKWDL